MYISRFLSREMLYQSLSVQNKGETVWIYSTGS